MLFIKKVFKVWNFHFSISKNLYWVDLGISGYVCTRVSSWNYELVTLYKTITVGRFNLTVIKFLIKVRCKKKKSIDESIDMETVFFLLKNDHDSTCIYYIYYIRVKVRGIMINNEHPLWLFANLQYILTASK